MDIESVYCFNCDNEAIVYVDWTYSDASPETHRSFMCRTCADAFEFGQCVSDEVRLIDD
jgi:Fe2+ or Zn2+ uptake regulation protein